MSSFHRTRNISLFALIVLVMCSIAWQPQKTYAAGGGTASWTDGGYADRNTIYSYKVIGAPPNVCGTLNITRNGVTQPPGIGWICTDSNGNATKGPWGPPTSDETATGIYISWPDGSVTSGADKHINDVNDPTVSFNQSGGAGAPIPSAFSGTASDAQWGTGFKFNPSGYRWSIFYATFYNVSTGRYYRPGYGYTNLSEWRFYSSYSNGHTFNWSVTPPPSGDHNAINTYRWCVTTSDLFYTVTRCVHFYGPR